MKRRWKILAGILIALLLIAGGGFVWTVFLQPNRPAPIVAPGPTGQRIAEGSLFGNYYPAPGPGRQPAILLLGGSEGGLSRDIRLQALLLQRAGFTVLHLAYFNVPGKSSKLERVPLETFASALDWLKARPEVDPDAIALAGYSKGAEAALLTASRYPGLRAVVAGMPSSVAWDALSMRSYIFGGISSWTEGGRDLPSLAYGPGDETDRLLPRFANALATLDRHPEVVIPVERFRGRLLMLCGARDTLWPSCPMAEQVAARARHAGGPTVELLTYPEAGHGVMGGPVPPDHPLMRPWRRTGGAPGADSAARADSWPRIVRFLNAALRPGAAP
jgi:hypothetical protein